MEDTTIIAPAGIPINDRYLIMGILPVLRKRRFFRDFFKDDWTTYHVKDAGYSIKRKVRVDPRFIRVDGVSLVGDSRNTATREEAYEVARGMLMSSHGFESAIIQDLLHPEDGQALIWPETGKGGLRL